MSEKDIIVKEQLKYSGFGDFKAIYNYAHDWLKNEEFSISEDKYQEKIKGDAKEIEIVWKISRKLTDYFKIEGDVKIKIDGMKDVEVQIDGKKKKMNEFQTFTMDVKGTLVKDYQNKWASPSSKFFKELYDKYIIPNRTEKMEAKVEETIQKFKDEIKAILELTGKR
jgi:D-hexose-6-phosphate mutarotase